jgi:hypothetical protein
MSNNKTPARETLAQDAKALRRKEGRIRKILSFLRVFAPLRLERAFRERALFFSVFWACGV